MTPDELYNRAEKQMKLSYTSGISCIEDAKTTESLRFFRDFTQGEIEGIKELTTSLYLAFIYDHHSNNEKEEYEKYKAFCLRIRAEAKTLKDQILDYTSKIIGENLVY